MFIVSAIDIPCPVRFKSIGGTTSISLISHGLPNLAVIEGAISKYVRVHTVQLATAKRAVVETLAV
jgi:hypothetical protein